MSTSDAASCHCGRPGGYEACCRPIHLDPALAATAEDVMRARYSAYVERDEAYLRASWHPDTRPPTIAPLPDGEWLGLVVEWAERGDRLDADGTVAFTATLRTGGRTTELRETSRFGRWRGGWVYVDGSGDAANA